MYLEQILKKLSAVRRRDKAFISSLWLSESSTNPVEIDYAQFLINGIKEIIKRGKTRKISRNKNWSKRAIIYNLFIRFCTAYDHNQDGKIGNDSGDITVNYQGIRETGTFLKTIALLPYLKSLGINTIHVLPITKIGIEGRKGDLGSPYAIKNPFEIDPLLADPIIDFSVEDQYKALVEAAHLLNIRVVQEFIFRTAAIDSDWSAAHPDWFYWIKNDSKFAAPKFSSTELTQILNVPKGKGKFIPPGKSYRSAFIVPPSANISKNLKIASAFADWPPDDLQPWTDVTYLRLYNYDYKKDNNYNYIAYNTIRYYDPELAKKEHINHELWQMIADIIPYYQQTFGIDGAMIDMGHALPNELKSKIINQAREINGDFAFWDENFDNKEETKKDGYNAVIGDDWYKITKRNGFKKIIENSLDKKPLPHFGAAETHNSPRFGFGNAQKKKASWLLFNLLPNAIPFMHNGSELNEQLPVNTGLNFKQQQLDYLLDKRLPLFYKNSMNWDTGLNIVPFIKKIATIKNRYPWVFDRTNLSIAKTDNPKVLGYKVSDKTKNAIILFNADFYHKKIFMAGNLRNKKYYNPIHEKTMVFEEKNELKKGEFLMAILN